GAGSRQHPRIEFVAERFGAETSEQRLIIEGLAGNDLHVAKAARIIEDNSRARRHVEYHMVMRAISAARMVKFARRLLILILDNAKRARHAQMHQEHLARGKIRQQVFGAAAETSH